MICSDLERRGWKGTKKRPWATQHPIKFIFWHPALSKNFDPAPAFVRKDFGLLSWGSVEFILNNWLCAKINPTLSKIIGQLKKTKRKRASAELNIVQNQCKSFRNASFLGQFYTSTQQTWVDSCFIWGFCECGVYQIECMYEVREFF